MTNRFPGLPGKPLTVSLAGAVLVCMALPFVSTPAPAGPHEMTASSQFPKTVGQAMRLYEGDVEVDEWADGPVLLIMLEDEREIWKELESDPERRRFIEWFWARRDEDLRDPINPVMLAFYTRVGEANGRFTGIPRGWKTDRGRIWAVIGKPDLVRTDTRDENEVWNYWVPGLEPILGYDAEAGEMNIYFSRRDLRTFRIAGGVGPGVWPPYVIRVMKFVNEAMVANPDLEFRSGQD